MGKDAYYFSHDAGARHDPKVSAMRAKYGAEGYGRYWILVEMMREQADYRLCCNKPYTWSAYAQQMGCDAEQAQEFVEDCIATYELFASDGESFWSESLLRRMEKLDEIRKKRQRAGRKSAEARASQDGEQQDLNKCSTRVQQNPTKESKVKESKEEKESSQNAPPPVSPKEVVNLWNEICAPPLPKAQKLTPARRQKLLTRIAEDGERGPDWWRQYFQRIRGTPFCCGENDRGWTADIDWAIRSEDVVTRVLEGAYESGPRKAQKPEVIL